MCAAPKGNQFWKLIKPEDVGREKQYTPEGLLAKSLEYFAWIDEHPWQKKDVAKAGDHFGEQVTIDVQRPYTLTGLCLYLGITIPTFNNYEKAEGYEAYFNVCAYLKGQIYNQKFEGAAVGAFNHAIIARDLGLVDRKESKQDRTVVKLSPDEREKRINELLAKRNANNKGGK